MSSGFLICPKRSSRRIIRGNLIAGVSAIDPPTQFVDVHFRVPSLMKEKAPGLPGAFLIQAAN
jgi:hypothetical protein